jgi:glycosyltransferase involved in cell wall biosynthesis
VTPLSICAIMRNEEHTLTMCLSGMSEVATEIIVIDDDSSDDTHAAASRLGAKVYRSQARRDGSSNVDHGEGFKRNEYIERASCPWILVLDADERLRPEDVIALRTGLTELDDSVMGVRLNRLEYLGRGRWSSITMLRCFRRTPHIRYVQMDIHPAVAPSIVAQGGTIRTMGMTIHHFDLLLKERSFSKRDAYRQKMLTAKLAGADAYHQHMFACFLGLEYGAVGQLRDAHGMYLEARRLNADWKFVPLEELYLAQHQLRFEKPAEAKSTAARALARIDEGHGNFRADMLSLLVEKLALVLADVHARSNERKQALALIERALAANPASPHNFINLASLISDDDPEAARRCLDRALALNPLLADEAIYREGDPHNVFVQQVAFLSTTRSFPEQMVQSERTLQRCGNGMLWLELAQLTTNHSPG